ncbi:MAG TPA: MarR family transcriptional regulator [Planctomycetota bacterium]|nr:MarR family transcriptional regulator [Planctomycetota bacterium]
MLMSKSNATPPLDSPERRRLPPLLRKAWYGLNQAFRRRIKHIGATPDQYTILRLLREGPTEGLSQRDLCRLMSSDPNTIAALAARMEEQGIVARRADERDKRAQRVTATAKGKVVFRKLRAIALALQSEILATLPEERRKQFLADLDAVGESCRAMAEEER